MKRSLLTITVLAVICTVCPGWTQQSTNTYPTFKSVNKVAQAGYQFLKIGPSARYAGMGEAVVTLDGDASTVFTNPAGIAAVENRSFFAGYTTWFADMKYQAASAAVRVGNIGVFGLSAVYMDNGSILGTKISNNNIGYEDTGSLNVAEYAVGLSYGKKFTDRFQIGVTTKYCSQDLVAKKSAAVAFDIGTIYRMGWNDLRLAVSIQHFSKELKYIAEYFELPLIYRVGVSASALDMLGLSSKTHHLTVAVEGVNPRDYSERLHVGAEYWFSNLISLRGGYKFNYDVESFSFGAGLRLKIAEIDYAYSDFGGILGAISRFSILVNF